jgi:hypothetical protein
MWFFRDLWRSSDQLYLLSTQIWTPDTITIVNVGEIEYSRDYMEEAVGVASSRNFKL